MQHIKEAHPDLFDTYVKCGLGSNKAKLPFNLIQSSLTVAGDIDTVEFLLDHVDMNLYGNPHPAIKLVVGIIATLTRWKKQKDIGPITTTFTVIPHTPLHMAALNAQTTAAAIFLRRGADVNSKASRIRATPLHMAAMNGDISMIELLLAHGASADTRDRRGRTPKWYADAKGHKAASARLAQAGIAGDMAPSKDSVDVPRVKVLEA